MRMGLGRFLTRRALLAAASVVLALAASVIGTVIPVCGQTVQGDVTGTVRDETGGVIPGARVSIINEATGAVRTLETNENGEYRAVGFFVGSYRVEVEQAGFKKAVVPGVKVESVTVKRVDVFLSVGDIAESVTVSDSVPVVQTEGPTVNSNVPNVLYAKPIGDFTRSGWALNPAMWATGSSGGYLGVFLWGGVDGSQTELQVEGGQQSFNYFLNPTSIQEVSIVGGAPPAEYARAVNVNTTFKSGTNELHGTVLVSLFTPALSAVKSPFFRGNRTSAFPQWRFNYDVGGPVYIPRVFDGRNKAFFYFNLSRPRGFTSGGEVPESIPTQRMMTGDYSRFPIKPKDPLTGQPFPNDLIPSSRISPVATNAIKDLYRDIRYVGANADAYVSNGVVDFARRQQDMRMVLKFDTNLGTKDVLVVSWQKMSRVDNHSLGVNIQDLPAGYGSFTGAPARQDRLPQTRVSIGHTRTFSPNLVNQVRVAVLRDTTLTKFSDSLDGSPVMGKDVLARWGIQGITPVDLSGYPAVYVQNWAYTKYPTGAGQWDSRYQANENLTYVRGSHMVKAGVSGVKGLLDNEYHPGFGTFRFDGRFTGEPHADFLLGLPGAFDRGLARPAVARRIWEYGAYVQDDWRLSPRLSASFGVRWDRFSVPYDKNGMYYNFDLATGKIVVPDQFALDRVNPVFNTNLIPVVLGSSLGYKEKLREPSSRYLPRFGFAYRPTGSSSMVIRGGYGFYNGALRFAGLQFAGPFTASESFTNGVVNGRPLYAWPSAFPATSGKSPSAATGDSVSKDFRPEYTQTWNLSMERELWAGWGIRLTYMGNRSSQLPFAYNANTPLVSTQPFSQSRRPYPAFQSVTRVENGANSRYNALQMVFHHPFRNGLHLEISFTEQRAWTDQGGGGSTGFQRDSGPSNQGGLDYAYDRHRDLARGTVWPDHDLLINWAYDLPVGPEKRFLSNPGSPAKWVLARVLGGWSMTGTFNWHSGYFFTPRYTGADPGNISQFGGRADVIPGCNVYTGATLGEASEYFNRACFKVPANGTLGNAAINSLVGPGQWMLNVSPFKEFRLPRWDKGRVRIGANISNILNHAVYGPPSGIINTVAGARLTNYPFTRRGTEGQGQRNMIVMANFLF